MTTPIKHGISYYQRGSHYANVIRNPRFEIDQRAGTYVDGDGYTLDGWVKIVTGSTATVTQQTFTLGQTDVPYNPKKYIRYVVTTVAGASNRVALLQRIIEGVQTFAEEVCTLSFYAKADASKNIAIELVQNFGSGGSPSAQTSFGVTTKNLSTSWAKYTVTVAIPSISGKTLGTYNNNYLGLIFWFDAGSNWNPRTNSLGQQSGTFDIADVVLNHGNIAMPISWCMRNPQEELALNQRYLYMFPIVAGMAFVQGWRRGSALLAFVKDLPVAMRAVPTIIQTGFPTSLTSGAPGAGQCTIYNDAGETYVTNTGTFAFNGLQATLDRAYFYFSATTFSGNPQDQIAMQVGSGIQLGFSAEI